MANYFYKKYTAKKQYSSRWTKSTYTDGYTYWPSGTTYRCSTSNPNLEFGMMDDFVGINTDTGYYMKSYDEKLTSSSYLMVGYEYIIIQSPSVAITAQGNRAMQISDAESESLAARWPSNKYTLTVSQVMDKFVGEVIAPDGTYPDNGYNENDGYYYVKDRVAIEFKSRISGAWVSTTPYVRVNGVWQTAQVHPRVDGAWLG